MVRLEGNMSLKNRMTPPEIDPGTVRLVAQRLNHYTTPGPKYQSVPKSILAQLKNCPFGFNTVIEL